MRTKKSTLLICALGLLFLLMKSSIVVQVSGDTIVWHSNVKQGMIVGWELVELESYIGEGAFEVGDKDLILGDILQLSLNSDVSTDPLEVYYQELPECVDLLLNGEKLDETEEVMLGDFLEIGLSVLPLNYQLNDGTVLNSADFVTVVFGATGSILQGDYVVTLMEEDDGETMSKNHKDTGVAYEISAQFPYRGSFKWVYSPNATNFEITGNTIASRDDSEWDMNHILSGLVISFLVVVVTLTVYTKKHYKSKTNLTKPLTDVEAFREIYKKYQQGEISQEEYEEAYRNRYGKERSLDSR